MMYTFTLKHCKTISISPKRKFILKNVSFGTYIRKLPHYFNSNFQFLFLQSLFYSSLSAITQNLHCSSPGSEFSPAHAGFIIFAKQYIIK